jgi:hypothetical protein
MADLSFDDLIPKQDNGKSLTFDDLIPPPAAAPAKQPHQYSVLPISEDEQGRPHFDSNAGILGSIKSAFTLPGDVYAGKVDPNSDEGIARAVGLAGLAGPTNTFGSTIAGGVRMAAPKVEAPSAEALKSASKAGYEAVKGMGVDYASEAVSNLSSSLRRGLENDGIIRELAPKTHAVIDKLGAAPPNSVAPLSGLEAARRTFGHAAKDFANPTEQLAAKRAQEGLEGFIGAPPDGAVAGGQEASAKSAATALGAARENYAAAKRSERLSGVADTADLNAAVSHSGQNLDNALRQRVRSILTNPKQRAGFSSKELAALEGVARGTPSRNALRFVGNLAGGGGGLGAVASGATSGVVGTAAGGPLMGVIAGAAVPATGIAAKKLANALTSKALSRADELVRQRSPLYEQILKNAPPTRVEPTNSAALVRALLAGAPVNMAAPDPRGNPLANAIMGR